jgi:hypothetical protein
MLELVRAARQFETRGFDLVTVSLDDPAARDKVAFEEELTPPSAAHGEVAGEGGAADKQLRFEGNADAWPTPSGRLGGAGAFQPARGAGRKVI